MKPENQSRKQSRRGFTLAEMIMAVAMLAFFSVFIVQMFAKAEQLSARAACLDQAVLTASEWADEWKRPSGEGLSPEIAYLLANKENGLQQQLLLDDQHQPCDRAGHVYTAVLTVKQEDDHIWTLAIQIHHNERADKALIYALDVSRFIPEEAES